MAQSFCPQDPDPFDQQDLRLNSEYTPGQCPANDIQIVGAFLDTGEVCNSCISGDEITANFSISINHNTNSGDRFLGVFADLTETRPDGSVAVCKIARSSGPVLKNSEQSGNQQVLDYGEVTFTCGSQLVLDNILLVWTAANGESPVTPQNNPNGKYCYANPVINIVPPLNAVATASCNSNNLSDVDLVVSGGAAPLSYSWSGPGEFNAMSEDLVDLDNETTYNVTVTDAEGCTTSTSITTPICFICPTLSDESLDITTCEDEQGQILSVNSNVDNIDIRFVYFTSQQSNPYVGGTQIGAIVSPTGGTATSTEGISNLDPGTYYAYAILDTNDSDLTDANCRPSATIVINITESVSPTFDAIAAICEGEVLAALPTTSTNGIEGTWSPALDNTQTTEYTFTPVDGECAETTSLTIEVGDKVVPTFDPVAAICEGETLAALPTTSTNGIEGTWSPALDNTQTTEYTFTP
ncbi:hypothetical protein Q4500_16680, partial [Maribacter sp. 1_MG-2023]|nr:hypothetical protein [Maribacter sp. 1_MG-2023]